MQQEQNDETTVERTRYCYHCSKYHPESEMKQISTKSGARWRCVKSIESTKRGVAERDAFGKANSQANVFWSGRPKLPV